MCYSSGDRHGCAERSHQREGQVRCGPVHVTGQPRPLQRQLRMAKNRPNHRAGAEIHQLDFLSELVGGNSLALSGLMFSQIGTLLVGVILVWWMFPLIFSAHGYFLYREKLWFSIRRSIHLTRLTFPITGTLILLVILVSQVMDMLWNTPQSSSWLMLLGVAGHAFITTALLAASFVYYRDTSLWIRQVFEQMQSVKAE